MMHDFYFLLNYLFDKAKQGNLFPFVWQHKRKKIELYAKKTKTEQKENYQRGKKISKKVRNPGNNSNQIINPPFLSSYKIRKTDCKRF